MNVAKKSTTKLPQSGLFNHSKTSSESPVKNGMIKDTDQENSKLVKVSPTEDTAKCSGEGESGPPKTVVVDSQEPSGIINDNEAPSIIHDNKAPSIVHDNLTPDENTDSADHADCNGEDSVGPAENRNDELIESKEHFTSKQNGYESISSEDMATDDSVGNVFDNVGALTEDVLPDCEGIVPDHCDEDLSEAETSSERGADPLQKSSDSLSAVSSSSDTSAKLLDKGNLFENMKHFTEGNIADSSDVLQDTTLSKASTNNKTPEETNKIDTPQSVTKESTDSNKSVIPEPPDKNDDDRLLMEVDGEDNSDGVVDDSILDDDTADKNVISSTTNEDGVNKPVEKPHKPDEKVNKELQNEEKVEEKTSKDEEEKPGDMEMDQSTPGDDKDTSIIEISEKENSVTESKDAQKDDAPEKPTEPEAQVNGNQSDMETAVSVVSIEDRSSSDVQMITDDDDIVDDINTKVNGTDTESAVSSTSKTKDTTEVKSSTENETKSDNAANDKSLETSPNEEGKRKRSPSPSSGGAPKKTRLSNVIGKLCDNIGIKPDMVNGKSPTNTDKSLPKDSRGGSPIRIEDSKTNCASETQINCDSNQVSNKTETKNEIKNDTKVDCNSTNDKKPRKNAVIELLESKSQDLVNNIKDAREKLGLTNITDSKDVTNVVPGKDSKPVSKSKSKVISFTEQELDLFVKKKMNEYLARSMSSILVQLLKQIESLQQINSILTRDASTMKDKLRSLSLEYKKLMKAAVDGGYVKKEELANTNINPDDDKVTITELHNTQVPVATVQANNMSHGIDPNKKPKISVKELIALQKEEIEKAKLRAQQAQQKAAQANSTPTATTPNILKKNNGKAVVVDLTDEDASTKATKVSTITTKASAVVAPIVQSNTVAATTPSSSVPQSIAAAMPQLVAQLPQGTLRPGTFLVQSNPTTGGAVILQPFVGQTSQQGAIMVQTNPSQNSNNVNIGAPINSPATAAMLPQLRPGSQLVPVRQTASAAQSGSPSSAVVNRPPPPLKAAPNITVPSQQQQLATSRGIPSTKPTQSVSSMTSTGNEQTSTAPRPQQSASPDLIITKATPPSARHPAPLPAPPPSSTSSLGPPKPKLRVVRVEQGIVLSWTMSTASANTADITNYQLFAYQESSAPPSTSLWKKVGNVNALPLPMACTLTQFQEGNRYFFAVRAVDKANRCGPFSDPSTILLSKQ